MVKLCSCSTTVDNTLFSFSEESKLFDPDVDHLLGNCDLV